MVRDSTSLRSILGLGPLLAKLDRRQWMAAGIALASVTLVGLFDMGTPLPISYEAHLRWSAQRLAEGHGLKLWPAGAFWAFVQIVLGAATAVAHLDPRVMRLTVVPFLIAAGWGEYLLARQLGADRWWATGGGLLLVCSPLTLALATGFASDVPYLGLFVLAATAGLRWVREGKTMMACVVLVLLAVAQRQYGAGVLVAVAAGLVLARNQRRVVPREWLWLVLGVGLTLTLGAAVFAGGLATPQFGGYLHDFAHPSAASAASMVWALAELPVMIAFVALPLLLPLALSIPRKPTYGQLVPMGLAVLSLVGCGLLLGGMLGASRLHSILPGEWFGQAGVGPAHMPGTKPELFSTPVFVGIELASIAVMLLALVWRADLWKLGSDNAMAGYLGVLALSQFPAIYGDVIVDRHFLPEVAIVLPVLVAALTTSNFRARWLMKRVHVFVLCLAVVEVATFAVGEQDLQAWTTAVGRAASAEIAVAPPSAIDAGPLNTQLVDIPFYERTGRLPTYPRPVRYYLAFAPLGDREPGFDYHSFASGRVVVRCTGKTASTDTATRVASSSVALDWLPICP